MPRSQSHSLYSPKSHLLIPYQIFKKPLTSDSLAPLAAKITEAPSFEMNNLRSSKTDPAQAIMNANIALVTVNREDSLTQLVNAHAIKTKPAVTHSYVKLSKFKSQILLDTKKNRLIILGTVQTVSYSGQYVTPRVRSKQSPHVLSLYDPYFKAYIIWTIFDMSRS